MTDGIEKDPYAYRVPTGCLGFMVILPDLEPTLAVVTLEGFAREIARTEREILHEMVFAPEDGDPRSSVPVFNTWRAARFSELRRAGADGDMPAVGAALGRLMWAAVSYPGRAELAAAKVAEAVSIYGHAALALVDDGKGRVATVTDGGFVHLRRMTAEFFARVPLPRPGETACYSMVPDAGERRRLN